MEDNLEPDFEQNLAFLVLPDLDYSAQLFAIRNELARHREFGRNFLEKITKAEEVARRADGLMAMLLWDKRTELCEQSVYQDAAYSMAAVGMLAPFAESVFHQAFLNIRKLFVKPDSGLPLHARWEGSDIDQWDCHYIWIKGRRESNLVKGIMQLSAATGLLDYLPENLEQVLNALFLYRNKMFHHGLEWPSVERLGFEKTIQRNKWEQWFDSARRGNDPWIFFLSAVFIDCCIDCLEATLVGVGRYVKASVTSSSAVSSK
jgi:hypothetical protein